MTLRIAHVISTPSGFGGAEQTLGALVQGGDVRGARQTVLNPFAVNGSAGQLVDACAPVAVRSHPCAHAVQLPGVRRWLRKELDAFRPDIIHAHLFQAAALVASLPRAGNGAARVLSHQHGNYYRRHRRYADAAADRWAGRRFDRVVAVSSSVQRLLVESFGYPLDKVGLIPNGWFGEPVPRRRESTRPTVVCVARFRPEKMHTTLLAAFARVRGDVPDARLVLVGDGPAQEQVRQRAAALGLSDAVEMPGATSRVWDHLADADVFALASQYETFGIAVLEAMAAGLPVVATRTGGLPELVVPGVTGELVPVGDDAAMAEEITHLLRDPDRRQRMSGAARAAAAPLHIDHIVAAYFDLYAELADRPARAVG